MKKYKDAIAINALILFIAIMAVAFWSTADDDDPVVDGTPIPTYSIIQFKEKAAPPVAPAGYSRIYMDATQNALYKSENGGAYSPLGSGSAGASAFTDLTDTFEYTGLGGQYVKVKAAEDGLETGTPAGGGDMTKAEYDTDDNGVVDSVDTELDPLVGTHESTYNHSNYNDAYSHKTTEDAINGIVKVDGAGGYSAAVPGTDYELAGAVGTHEGTYNHALIATALQSESDPLMATHESTYNHALIATALQSESDPLMATHESTYNHALIATALQSELDPVFASSEAAGITSTDTSNWDTAYQRVTGTTFGVSPSSAPTTDYQYANKKYVDDNAGGGGISNVVEDLTPQLGGDLDCNGKNISVPVTSQIQLISSALAIYGEEEINTEMCFKDDNTTSTLQKMQHYAQVINLTCFRSAGSVYNIDVDYDALTIGNYYDTAGNITIDCDTGTGANAIDTGALAASKWYAIHVIYNPTSKTEAGLISLSRTAPTLPAGYTAFRCIGWARSTADSEIKYFQYAGNGLWWQDYNQTFIVSSGTATTWTAVDISSYIPPTAYTFIATGRSLDNGTNAEMDVRPTGSSDNRGIFMISNAAVGGGSSLYVYSFIICPTNYSQSFDYQMVADDTNVLIVLNGYYDSITPQ